MLPRDMPYTLTMLGPKCNDPMPAMSKDLAIRLLQDRDEASVRRICFDTALYGKSIRPILRDERLVTQALLGSYLRFERSHFWVAVSETALAGYVCGGLEASFFSSRHAWRILPGLLGRFLAKGHAWNPAVWRFLRAGAVQAAQCKAIRNDEFLARYPAHLHVNLAPAYRGAGVGRRLVGTFLQEASTAGVPGLHVSVGSPSGWAFFKQMGFEEHAAFQIPSVEDGSPRTAWILVKKLQERKTTP